MTSDRLLTADEAQDFQREMADRGMSDLGDFLSFTWDGPGKQRRGPTERSRARRIAKQCQRNRAPLPSFPSHNPEKPTRKP